MVLAETKAQKFQPPIYKTLFSTINTQNNDAACYCTGPCQITASANGPCWVGSISHVSSMVFQAHYTVLLSTLDDGQITFYDK